MDAATRQRVRYLRTKDGIQLAWAEAGSGPVIAKASNWLSHLEYEWESPVWRPWMRFFSGHYRYVRYDERGCGMTDWTAGDISLERWIEDLGAVLDAAGVREPITLLGISQGALTCVGFAARYPERVSRLILYGGYARGAYHRGDPKQERLHRALIELIRFGWGTANPAFRQLFASRFIPDASAEQGDWFNSLCQRTTTPEIAAQLMEARASADVSHLLPKIQVPTLVLHSRGDAAIPISEGRIMASGIRNAQFVELDSRNHILLENEPAWQRFREMVLEFTGVNSPGDEEDRAFVALSPREREILALISQGLGNSEIGERLSISEKTVRNHVSNVFDKLGVWTRAQAIVLAHDRGFRG
jgi:pimeloyl-ACP methyl ester carboxylesterase/DNA-binding CsgD family transcriptional regulator